MTSSIKRGISQFAVLLGGLSVGLVGSLFAPASFADAESEPPPVEKVLFDFGDGADTETAADAWRLNIFGENADGEAGSGAVEIVETDAPFGQRALRFTSNDAGTFNLIGEVKASPDADWRKHTYRALEIWYRGNGNKRNWRVHVHTDHADPEIGRVRYRGTEMFLGETEWRRLVITDLPPRDKNAPELDWSQLSRVLILGRGSEQIEIQRISLIGGERTLPLHGTDKPTVFVPEFSAAPTIDGKPDEQAWDQASTIPELRKHEDSSLAGASDFPTTVRLGYRGQRLYLGASLQGEPTSLLQESRRHMNERLWEDPSFELFLDPHKSNHTRYQTVVNPLGTTWHEAPQGRDWELRAEIAAAIASDEARWSLEMDVDLEQFGEPVERGDIWGVNFARNAMRLEEGERQRERSGWSQGRFTPITGFGWLVFGRAPETAALEIEHLELSELEKRDLGLRFLARNTSDQTHTFTTQATFTPPEAEANAQSFEHAFTLEPGAQRLVTLPMAHEIEAEGDHRMRVAVRDADRRVHWHDTFVVPRNHPIEIEPDAIVLHPIPQRWEPKQGAWMLPERFEIGIQGEGDRFPAEHLADVLSRRYGVEVAVTSSEEAQVQLAYNANATENDEGFVLNVTTDGVALEAADGPGMYYGVRALLDIVRQSSLGDASAQARAVHCADWPKVSKRVANKRLVPGASLQVPPSAEAYKQFIYEQIAGGRYNYFILQVRDRMIYETHPDLVDRRRALTKEQMREIIEFAHRHYVELIPGNNSPGHAEWIVQHRPELAYEGDRHTLDTRNPEGMEVIKDTYGELIDLFGSRYFHMAGDEVRWPPTDDREELEARRGRLLEHWTEVIEFLQSRGVTPILWDDMLSEAWNGGAPHHTARILPDLPRDIIISQWSDGSRANPASVYREHGFDEIWRVMTSFAPTRADRAVQWHDEWDAVGMGIFVPRPWSNFSNTNYERQLNYSTIAVHLAAAVAWNPPSVGRIGGDRLVALHGPHWAQVMDVPEWGVRQVQYEPISIEQATNHSTQDNWMDAETRLVDTAGSRLDIAGIPFDRPGMTRNAVRIEADQQSESIAIGRQVRGLAFLQTAGATDEDAVRALQQRFHKKNTAPYAMNIAHYLVQYEDGEQARIPVKLGWNVHFWNCVLGARIMPGIAGYWTGLTEAQQQRDPHRADVTFWAMEWKNPRPNVAIESITLKGAGTEASTALLGLTLINE